MASFRFVALDEQDKSHFGTLEARDRSAALQNLSDRYKLVTELVESRPSFPDRLRAALAPGVSVDELLIFTQQLSAVIAAGLPLKQALEFVVGDSINPSLVRAIEQVSAAVQQGSTVADALRVHPRVFPPNYVSMIKAGESSGNLPQTLDELARQLESSSNLAGKVKGAFAYPTVVIVFAGFLTFAILTFGMPMVKDLYGSLGGELPLPTRMLMGVSDFLLNFWYVWVLGIGVFLWMVKQCFSNPTARLAIDRFKLKLPVLGTLFRFLVTARFARNFGSVYKAGVPILEALELASPTVGNLVFQNILADVIRKVADGSTLAVTLRAAGFLPPLAMGMISAGEATGSLDQMLDRVANFYEVRIDMMLKSLSAMVEPILMIGVGMMMGTLILCIGLPFLNLSSSL